MRAAPLALAAAFLLLLAPLSAGLPPPPPPQTVGPILAITAPGDALPAALAASGYSACPPILPSGDCFDAVDASLFAGANLQERRVLVVGTHANGSAIASALAARKADIAAWTAAGGSLLSLAQTQPVASGYSAGGYEYVPNNAPWPFYSSPVAGDAVTITSYGSTHPAIPTSTDASLSGWGPSFEWVIGERPSSMFPIATGEGTATYEWNGTTYTYTTHGTVALAGNHGDGCVLLSTLLADRVAAAAGHPRAPDAQAFLRDVVEWGLHCGPVPPFPVPYGGAIRIGQTAGGPVTAQTSPGLSCSPLALSAAGYEVTCTPALAPSPGTVWTCLGQTVQASYVGLFSLKGTSMCDNAVAASCTAGTGSNGPACVATSSLAQAPLPIRCIAKPSSGTTIAQPTWGVTCGSVDP